MELRDYLKIITRSAGLIASMAVLFAVLAGIWSVRQPIRYESNAIIVVDKPTIAPAGATEYQYDKYYALEASDLFADTLAVWLASPSTVQRIYTAAGYEVPEISLKKMARIFKVNRQPTSNVIVTIADTDETKSRKLIDAAVAVTDEYVISQRNDEDPSQFFTIDAGETVTGVLKQNTVINVILGLLAGLILGMILAFLRAYLKQK